MLLPRKSEDALLRALGGDKVWHSTMREQRNSSCLQIVTDEERTILPYSYFQEARCRERDKTWEVVLYWPWVIVTVRGRNMDKMPELIAEHGLALLKFHPDGERVARDDFPEFESVTLTPRSENSFPHPPANSASREERGGGGIRLANHLL
jgi:hypothetical protein